MPMHNQGSTRSTCHVNFVVLLSRLHGLLLLLLLWGCRLLPFAWYGHLLSILNRLLDNLVILLNISLLLLLHVTGPSLFLPPGSSVLQLLTLLLFVAGLVCRFLVAHIGLHGGRRDDRPCKLLLLRQARHQHLVCRFLVAHIGLHGGRRDDRPCKLLLLRQARHQHLVCRFLVAHIGLHGGRRD